MKVPRVNHANLNALIEENWRSCYNRKTIFTSLEKDPPCGKCDSCLQAAGLELLKKAAKKKHG
jgi:7-cyano-7-deazaguanine synthase in queuosine biosynthesis